MSRSIATPRIWKSSLFAPVVMLRRPRSDSSAMMRTSFFAARSEEHTSELQSRLHLVCRLLLEKKSDVPTTYAKNLQQLRGVRISLLGQDPSLRPHPTIRIAGPVVEGLRVHTPLDADALRHRVS